MTKDEARAGLVELFGEDWPLKAAEATGIHRSTLWRYVSGETPVPPAFAWGLTKALETEKYLRWRRTSQRSWRKNNKIKA